jgi:alanine racemase
MPLTLYVDLAAWHQHLKAKVAEDPDLVPVAKGNGYGFTVPLLARTAAGPGVERIAVGSAQDATAVLPVFPGEVLVLDSPAGACPAPSRWPRPCAGSPRSPTPGTRSRSCT